jgi:hypothetical protein
MVSRFRFGLIAGRWLVGSTMAMAVLTSAVAAPMQDLPGYWTGFGSVTLANGSTEQLKCVVTYRVTGPQVSQLLRCASPSYTINAQANLSIAGDRVSGQWEEKTYSATGGVSGRMTDTGFTLTIQGTSFTAAMSVQGTDCQQTITIAPTGLDVTKISIGLGKC